MLFRSVHEYDEDSDTPEGNAENPVLQISLHALQGKKSNKYTFTLCITVGNHKALALVDTGSTTTFVTPEFANKENYQLTPTLRQKVQVANGKTIWTEFACKQAHYEIQGVPFTTTFRLLNLKGYDIILGADWIYDHSPVELNLKALTLKVQHDSGPVTFLDTSLPPTADIPHSINFQRLLNNSTCGALLMVKPRTPS